MVGRYIRTREVVAMWTAVLGVFAAATATADRVSYDWGLAYGPDETGPFAVVPAPDGSLYLAGNYSGLTDLCPGPEVASLPDSEDAKFLVKLDSTGALQWARRVTGTSNHRNITNDFELHDLFTGTDGAVYVVGTIGDDIVFDPDGEAVEVEVWPPYSDPLNQEIWRNGFLAKYGADGVFHWVCTLGEDTATGVNGWWSSIVCDVDNDGNAYLAVGSKPGLPKKRLWSSTGTTDEIVTETLLTVYKLDPNAGLLWVREVEPSDPNLRESLTLHGVRVSPDGYPYLVGSMFFPADFDPGPDRRIGPYGPDYDYMSGSDGFYWSLTPDGDFHSYGFIFDAETCDIESVEFDANGTVYLTEFAPLGTDIDPTDGILINTFGTPPAEGTAITRMVARLNPDGTFRNATDYRLPSLDELVYVHWGSTVQALGYRFPVDDRGQLYPVVAAYGTELQLPGLTVPVGEQETAQGFVCLNPDDRYEWGVVFGTKPTGTFVLHSLRPGDQNDLIGRGAFSGNVDLDPTTGVDARVGDEELREFIIRMINIPEPDARSITRADANPTNAATVAFTVTFDEPVTGVSATDFALTTTGAVTGAAITGVTGSDAVWTVTVNTGSGEGTIRLDLLDDDTIKSATNESLGGPGASNGAFADGESYTMDYTPPVATFGLPGSELSVINTVEVLVSFNEPVTGLDASDFAVTNGTITNITGDGTDFVITVLITNPGDMTLDLTGGGLTDIAGNGNGPTAGLTVTFLDINGDPSVPGPTGVLFVVLLLGMGLAACRPAPKGV